VPVAPPYTVLTRFAMRFAPRDHGRRSDTSIVPHRRGRRKGRQGSPARPKGQRAKAACRAP
jgi:hypothetical protein